MSTTFQIVDWYIPKYVDQINTTDLEKKPYNYDIHIYGVRSDNKTVFCCIKDFKPFFYVRAPTSFKKRNKALKKYKLWEQEKEIVQKRLKKQRKLR